MAEQGQGGDAIGRRFALLRKRAEQQNVARGQREADQLRRAEAQSGLQGSGAFIKQRQLAGQQREQEAARQREALDVAESGERFQQEQIKAQREFQKAEREAGQQFGAEQAAIARQFGREERERQQQFARGEAERARGFSRKLFDRELAFKEKAQDIAQSQFAKQFDLATKQFDLDEEVTRFNQKLAQAEFDKKTMSETFANMWGFDPRTGGRSDTGLGKVIPKGAPTPF